MNEHNEVLAVELDQMEQAQFDYFWSYLVDEYPDLAKRIIEELWLWMPDEERPELSP